MMGLSLLQSGFVWCRGLCPATAVVKSACALRLSELPANEGPLALVPGFGVFVLFCSVLSELPCALRAAPVCLYAPLTGTLSLHGDGTAPPVPQADWPMAPRLDATEGLQRTASQLNLDRGLALVRHHCGACHGARQTFPPGFLHGGA